MIKNYLISLLLIDLLKKTDNPYILTHNKKINTGKVIDQVVNDINKTIINLEKEGVDRKRIVIDPGFGFNKSIEQNIELHNDFRSEKFNNFP